MEKIVEKAGCVIIRENDGKEEVLLVYQPKNNDWTFPKGHMEPGETPEECARREIIEETGLEVEIIKNLPIDTYDLPHENSFAKIYFFLAKPSGGELRSEYDNCELAWLPIKEAAKKLSYENLKNYLRNLDEKDF